MAVNIKNTMFWDVMPCSCVDVYQCVRASCCLCLQGRIGRQLCVSLKSCSVISEGCNLRVHVSLALPFPKYYCLVLHTVHKWDNRVSSWGRFSRWGPTQAEGWIHCLHHCGAFTVKTRNIVMEIEEVRFWLKYISVLWCVMFFGHIILH
jgi:hypothetical protein